MPEIVIIAAVAEADRLIGKGLALPRRLSEDLKRFKRLTLGHPLVMGRRTFESLVHQFNGPLPGRRLVVLTSRGPFAAYPAIETYPSIEAVLAALADTEVVFIGGGATVYEHFLPLAHRMELTLVEGAYEGDTYFPPFEHLIGPAFEIAAEDQRDGFRFVTYVRTSKSRRVGESGSR